VSTSDDTVRFDVVPFAVNSLWPNSRFSRCRRKKS